MTEAAAEADLGRTPPTPSAGSGGHHVLDNPVRSSLCGPHAPFAQRRGDVRRYPPQMSQFAAMPERPAAADWADLATLAGPGAVVPLAAVEAPPPAGWEVVVRGTGVQMTGEAVAGAPGGSGIVRLTAADVPEMLALTARTNPGPFLPRTIELGTFLGIRRGNRLVAMAGERVHPPGWTEISGVCTDAAHRGQGLATRLVLALTAGIAARGELPFLHVTAGNDTALRLYEALGFRARRTLTFTVVRVPPVA
ncbi:GNAT family N-acetyltransferase [Parafrankia sp. EUN1f]|uniref:GNAT family N-acetyltransferase n=1 Tax=Parafrankia sp. EUN1f TaxID=102897 RepID=UPI0001C463B5|nr:GNAT family N-acetyltransferase [Parafrankia sp. EUN1f]EFC81291.1 FR47 domain protein [Parafrankia sp. EUN1f]